MGRPLRAPAHCHRLCLRTTLAGKYPRNVSRAPGAALRSGDPRKRAGQPSSPDTASRKRVVVVALVAGAVLLALAFVALRPAGGDTGEVARDHADVACDLTSKADEAAQANTRARYAAAVLLLDTALIESGRASRSDARFNELDEAVEALHMAGHRGDPDRWRTELDRALSACRTSTG